MIDFSNPFHVGVRVPDIEAAMYELGESLGLVWSELRDTPGQALWTPTTGMQEIPLRYTYSAAGPLHIELLQGPPGTFWDGDDRAGAHHLGVWADDVAAETNRLIDLGWTLVGAHGDPAEGAGYGIFTYLQPPSGLIVELVDRMVLPMFEQWWSAALT